MKLFENKYVSIELPASIERAWTVAQAAKKSLLVISSDRIFYNFADESNPPYRFIVLPCPCGYFGSQLKKCDCSVSAIEKHQTKLRSLYGECLWAEGNLSSRSINFSNLDGASAQMIKHAIGELQLTGKEIVKLIETAEAIAKLEGQVIHPEHIAEATSYRTK